MATTWSPAATSRLAEDHGIVLINGGGFEAPDWSVRVSFASLNDDVYDGIGRAVRAVARGYYQAYQLATGKAGGIGVGAGASPKTAKARTTKTKPGGTMMPASRPRG